MSNHSKTGLEDLGSFSIVILSLAVITPALTAFRCTAWPLSDRGTKDTQMPQGETGMSGYYLSSNKMVWLHFHSLLALSRVRGTLVFLPYIKVIAVSQTPKDTSLLTLQHDGFSSFVTHGKQDLSLLHRNLAPHAGHHRIIMVGKALQD